MRNAGNTHERQTRDAQCGLIQYFADLHAHTALSPCAGDSCAPPNIVRMAMEHGMNMIAITDHNSAENVQAVMRCGERAGLKVLPGMEVTTAEEVHVVCIFDTAGHALALQSTVYALLPDEANAPEIFGRQMVMDELGNIVGECEKLLAGAARITLRELTDRVRELDGIAIAAHIDRPAYSVMSNLGFIPEDAGLDALEMSASTCREKCLSRFPGVEKYPLVTSSDAHIPSGIGVSPTMFLLEKMSVSEIRLALKFEQGREYLTQ